MTSIFEGQPSKRRPFPIKTRLIWLPGYIYIYVYTHILSKKIKIIRQQKPFEAPKSWKSWTQKQYSHKSWKPSPEHIFGQTMATFKWDLTTLLVYLGSPKRCIFFWVFFRRIDVSNWSPLPGCLWKVNRATCDTSNMWYWWVIIGMLGMMGISS